MWFLSELFLRFLASPDFVGFVMNWMTWLDVLAVVPSAVLYFVTPESNTFTFLRILKLARFVRKGKYLYSLKFWSPLILVGGGRKLKGSNNNSII